MKKKTSDKEKEEEEEVSDSVGELCKQHNIMTPPEGKWKQFMSNTLPAFYDVVQWLAFWETEEQQQTNKQTNGCNGEWTVLGSNSRQLVV